MLIEHKYKLGQKVYCIEFYEITNNKLENKKEF